MSRLSQAEIDDIRARIPIEHVAEQYVRLRRAAGRLVGPCPMCGGRATSQRFEVFASEDSWACAVCHDGGDVIRLVEKAEGLDFRAAIERLGGAAQIDPDQARRLFEAREKKRLAREKQTEAYREKERKRLWGVWSRAQTIHDTPAARYLEGRGLAAGVVSRAALPSAGGLFPWRGARRARPQIAACDPWRPGDARGLHPAGRPLRRTALHLFVGRRSAAQARSA
jgi:DNA primase